MEVRNILTFPVTLLHPDYRKVDDMDFRYSLIDACLKELRHCAIPAMPKLRLEVQLFQIKLLLLGDKLSGDAKGRYCSEAVLQELQQQLAALRDGEVTGVSIEGIRLRLQQIALDLAEAALTVPAPQER